MAGDLTVDPITVSAFIGLLLHAIAYKNIYSSGKLLILLVTLALFQL